MLYDPALKKLIHTITRKVFAQLLNEFKRLGAVVVYADLRRIGLYIRHHVLCTTVVHYISCVTVLSDYFDFLIWRVYVNPLASNYLPWKTIHTFMVAVSIRQFYSVGRGGVSEIKY